MRTIMYYLATAGYDAEEQRRRHAIMSQITPAGYQIAFAIARGAPDFLDGSDDFRKAIDAIAHHISDIGPEHCDALILGGALDPGIAEARGLAKIPVIAPGEASLFIAAQLNLKTAIVTVDEHAVGAARRLIEQTAIRPEIVAIRSMNTPVRTIVSNLEAGRTALMAEISSAIHEDNAEAIYLGSMTLPTLGPTEQLREKYVVPIYDPLRISIRIAVETIVSRMGDIRSF